MNLHSLYKNVRKHFESPTPPTYLFSPERRNRSSKYKISTVFFVSHYNILNLLDLALIQLYPDSYGSGFPDEFPPCEQPGTCNCEAAGKPVEGKQGHLCQAVEVVGTSPSEI
jgi:hypothetical protein